MNSIIQLAPGIDKITEGSLYPHQADGVAFLLSKKRAILADDMGLGKTRQAIVAMEAGCPEGTVLVVCPASLKLNWRREILMVDSKASIEVLGVDKDQTDAPRWIIINYDILSKYAERLHTIDWAGIILDEAHFIKNASKRTTHCLKLLGVQAEAHAPLIGPDYVFLLTGTPMTNRPKDLFNLFRCVGHPAARSFLSFAKRYCDTEYNGFAFGSAPSEALNLRTPPTNIGFVNFDVAGQRRLTINLTHMFADFFSHAKRCWIRNSQLTLQFLRRYAVPCRGEQIHGIEPLLQRCMGPIKHSPDHRINLKTAPRAFIGGGTFNTMKFTSLPALRAFNSLAVAKLEKVVQTRIIIWKLFEKILDCRACKHSCSPINKEILAYLLTGVNFIYVYRHSYLRCEEFGCPVLSR